MTVLSDTDLIVAMQCSALMVDPAPLGYRIQPASIDLTLGSMFRELPATSGHLRPVYVDPWSKEQERWIATETDGASFHLRPNGFALGTTAEHVGLDNMLVGILAGKSSLAREGLQVEAAGYVDPGFQGQLTLELKNMHPDRWLTLQPGQAIAQLAVYRLSSPCARPYGDPELRSRYQWQTGPTSSRLHEVA